MSFRTYIPVNQVRGHVVKAWFLGTPARMGWEGTETLVWAYLLDDGRLVGQDWEKGREEPFRHYIKARTPAQVGKKVAEIESSASWEEVQLPVPVVGGRFSP